MEQISINDAIKDIKIQQLEEEVKRLKEIIAWQSFTMAGIDPKTKQAIPSKKQILQK